MDKASMVSHADDGQKIVAYVTEDGEVHDALEVSHASKLVDYVNPATGKASKALAIKRPAANRGEWWWKVMLSDMLRVLDGISGKQNKALKAILDSFDPHSGIVIKSQREMAEDAGCSLMTVNKVMKILQKENLVKMKKQGIYAINPRFMSQGGKDHFNALLYIYDEADMEVERYADLPMIDVSPDEK